MTVSSWTPAAIAEYAQQHRDPFELLAAVDAPSVLDVGAGDLTFAAELVDRYLPTLVQAGRKLTLHCLDRLDPGSRLGGPLHPDAAVLQRLRALTGLKFRFWPNQDMFAPALNDALLPRYTIASCQAPATPTFAYEPSRFSPGRIEEELRRTKGEFRRVKADGEDALEVLHGGRVLLFPPWKFDVRGPLALLELLACRGKLCVVGAVDDQVFWELLVQLIEPPAGRDMDVMLTAAALADRLGSLYRELSCGPIGSSWSLGAVTELRRKMPRVRGHEAGSYSFRYVEVRRGVPTDGMPVGTTARLFGRMKEEVPPWWLILVPND